MLTTIIRDRRRHLLAQSSLVLVPSIGSKGMQSIPNAGFVARLRDPAKAIEHASVDEVVIAPPTDTHARLIELAANAGKAVFSEKANRIGLS